MTAAKMRKCIWLRPELVAQFEFLGKEACGQRRRIRSWKETAAVCAQKSLNKACPQKRPKRVVGRSTYGSNPKGRAGTFKGCHLSENDVITTSEELWTAYEVARYLRMPPLPLIQSAERGLIPGHPCSETSYGASRMMSFGRCVGAFDSSHPSSSKYYVVSFPTQRSLPQPYFNQPQSCRLPCTRTQART